MKIGEWTIDAATGTAQRTTTHHPKHGMLVGSFSLLREIATRFEAARLGADHEDVRICEACGHLDHYDDMRSDSEGVPLCLKCYDELVAETKKAAPTKAGGPK